MTVYVVQSRQKKNKATGAIEPLDFSAADEFGERVFLLGPTASPFRMAQSGIIDEMHSKLDTFGSDDYLLLVGNPVLLAVAFCIAADYNDGDVRCLQWSGGAYIPIDAENVFRLLD